jgi:hypothetical protein
VNLKIRDGAMTAWKGWIIFKVYMPAVPDRYGIKAYLVSKSKSGSYIIWMVYWEIMTNKTVQYLDFYNKSVEVSEMLLKETYISVVHCV